MKNKIKKNDKALDIDNIIAIMPTEKEIDEWFTSRSSNPPYCNIKTVEAIKGANKYRAIMLQRLEQMSNLKR